MTEALKKRLMGAGDAVRLIPDGATVQIAGTALVCSSAMIFVDIGKSYAATGHPRDLCVVSYGSPSTDLPGYSYFEHLTSPGLLKRVVGGHMGYHHALFPLIRENRIEGYNISQGIISIMTSECVAGKKGYLTKVGLGTQQDPRRGGCKLNKGLETEDLVELRVVDGEEYLYYKMIKPDVTVIKASFADPCGNVTLSSEPSVNDAMASAMATRNNGGKVIVYVKGVKDERFDPRLVHLPAFLVDAIIVDPDAVQVAPHLPYSPYFSGEERCGEEEMRSIIEAETKRSPHKRDDAHKVIARRAAMELRPGAVVNIGIGIPQMIASEAMDQGFDLDSVVMTTETGIAGGVQLPSVFGVSMNPDSIYDMASQFRFYEGGGLDLGFLGALELDAAGNVNVCSKGPYLAGVGGFNFIVHSAKKLVFCFTFMRGSTCGIRDGKLVPADGKEPKIVRAVESVTMNAGIEFGNGKTVLYVTERCVFRLDAEGIELVEIAPGLRLKEDVLEPIGFPVRVSQDLAEMPSACFDFR